MPEDFAERLNASPEGWVHAMDVRFVSATADEVRAEWDVQPQHLQGYGLVHGGVHAGVVETLCSVGAHLYGLPLNLSVVGLENHTSFLRAVRSGRLKATARPLQRGRRTQVWETVVTDSDDRAVAIGRVRLLCLETDAALAGERLERPA
jgi:uncharacterized protein (TIGR00369 family)